MMSKKKFSTTLIFVGVFLFASSLYAGEKQLSKKEDSPKKTEKKEKKKVAHPSPKNKGPFLLFEISIPAFYIDIEDNTNNITTDGGSAGIRVAAQAYYNRLWGRLEINTGFGEVEQDIVGGSRFDVSLVNFEVALGYPLVSKKIRITPYFGFGPTFLSQDKNGVETDVFFFYFAVGGYAEYSLSDALRVGFDLSVRLLALGDVETRVSGVGNTTANLDANLGIRLQIPIRFFINPRLALSFTLFYEFIPLEGRNLPNAELHLVGAYIGGVLRM